MLTSITIQSTNETQIKFLENFLVRSKTKCFFLLPHFLMYAIPVLQHCEFYEDIRGRD